MGYPLQLSFGDKSLSIDPDLISIRKSKNLAAGITEIKKNLLFSQFPINEDETVDKWNERISQELQTKTKDVTRKENESMDDYLTRMTMVELDDLDLYFQVLKLIGDQFDQSKVVTSESFENVNLEAALYFMKDIFKRARIDLEQVFPKRF